MDHFEFDDVELAYEIRGTGARVVLIHASPFVGWYVPLVEHLRGFSVLRYRRRLRKQPTGMFRPLTADEDAAICARLMDHLGWPTAHVAGHSYGALVALQLATDASHRVRSLALLEPALRDIPSSPQVIAELQPVFAAYRSGDTADAVDRFLRTVCGDQYRSVMDERLPGGFADALAEADLFFQAEMPAVQQWTFGRHDAEGITQPVLNVRGAETAPRFVEGAELVQSWFPRAERLSVPDAGHLLMVQNPTRVAQGLTDFFAHHAIPPQESASR